MNMECYAAKRNMSVRDYIVWLEKQLDVLDFDDMPIDVAAFAAQTFGIDQSSAEELVKMEETQLEAEGDGI